MNRSIGSKQVRMTANGDVLGWIVCGANGPMVDSFRLAAEDACEWAKKYKARTGHTCTVVKALIRVTTAG